MYINGIIINYIRYFRLICTEYKILRLLSLAVLTRGHRLTW